MTNVFPIRPEVEPQTEDEISTIQAVDYDIKDLSSILDFDLEGSILGASEETFSVGEASWIAEAMYEGYDSSEGAF